VSKQSAQDRYVTAITVVSCSSHHASLGNWSTGERRTHDLKPQAAMLTTESRVVSRSFMYRYCQYSMINIQILKRTVEMNLELSSDRSNLAKAAIRGGNREPHPI